MHARRQRLRLAAAFVVIAILLGVGVWRHRSAPSQTDSAAPPTSTAALPEGAPASLPLRDPVVANAAAAPLATAVSESEGSPLAAELNAPGFDTAHDLVVLRGLLGQFTTLYKPGQRPPLGDNGDITAALTRRNPQRIVFVSAGHRALHDSGQLIDRWGTPYFFHPRSGDTFDLRSAGPDRVPFTPDDIEAPHLKAAANEP